MTFVFLHRAFQELCSQSQILRLSVEQGGMKVWSPSFNVKIVLLSRATYLVSVGNNINSRWSPVASPTISRALPPIDVKGGQVANGYGASCSLQQHDFYVKAW